MTEQPSRWLSESVAAIILAGGRNSRMGGRDKAFLQVNGETVFSRTLGLLKSCFEQVVVVSNQPDKYASFEVDVTADELPGLGPLGGLHAGLGRVRAPYAFVTACDMPFLRVEPIRFLVSHLRQQDAVVPCWAGDIEPLHAIYATALRPRIAAAVAGGARAIRDFLPLVRVHYVAEKLMADVDGAEEAFRNVNTPEEAARFEVQVGG
jgi:molybdopterin-guanine dinucleotide biosynthesis protein A